MNISNIYQMLCLLYEPKTVLDIERYLLSIAPYGSGETVANGHMPGRETLFIRQAGEDLELGLFVAPQVVATLKDADPLLHLEELALAVEGASHFLYVADRADKNIQISKLELELQAEVDKFIIIHLLASERYRCTPWDLFEKQFEGFGYAPDLTEEERERYAAANHFAAKYCAHLRDRHFNPLRIWALMTEARDFFGCGLSAKLKRLIP